VIQQDRIIYRLSCLICIHDLILEDMPLIKGLTLPDMDDRDVVAAA